MDIITYALSKKIAAHALSGVQSMSVNGQTLIINTKDSEVLTITFPTPKDGVSVTDIDVNANNQIVFTMSDGTEIISGKIPTVKGDPGFSPIITENADNTDKIYKLDITTADSTFTTPNLKGADGQGGTGGSGEENIIDSISVNGVNITPDENKNVDITVPKVTNDLTDELKSSYDDAVTAKHTHDNKTVLNDITAEKVEAWDKAEENVQSDWNETDDTADGFIKNKPTIPDITGLATETYVDNKVADYTKTVDLADVATSGSYNDLIDKPTIPSLDGYAKASEIPSKVSELENDSNYLSSIPEEYVTDTELSAKGYLTEHQDISGKVDKVEGKSLISDTEIARLASVDNYDDTDIRTELANKADTTAIPSKVSELTNDSNYQTAEQVSSTVTTEIAKVVADAPEDLNTLKEMSDWIAGHEDDASAMNSAISDNKTAITALQTGKADKSEIPTTVAELTDSADYAKKTDLHSHTNKTVLDGITEEKVTAWDNKSDFSGNYNDLSDKPTIPKGDGTTITMDEDGTLHGVAKVTVDDAMSSTSTNPVQNKVVKAYVDKEVSENVDFSTSTSKILNGTIESPMLITNATRNLLNPELATTTQNGITCTNNGDGTYTLNGTATKNFTLSFINRADTLDMCQQFKGKFVKFISNINDIEQLGHSYMCIGQSISEDWTKWENQINNGKIAKISTQIYGIVCDLHIFADDTFDNILIKPMLTTDLNATYDDFVPYSGYDIKTCGKNLLDLKNKGRDTPTNGGITYTKQSDGSYKRTGTATDTPANVWMFGRYREAPNGTNHLLILKKGHTYFIADCVLFSMLDGVVWASASDSGPISIKVTPEKDIYVTGVRDHGVYKGNTYNDIVYPRIFEADNDLGWEPYTESTVHIDSSTEFPLFGLKSFNGTTNIISPGNVEVTYAKSDSGAAILNTQEKSVKDVRKETTVNLLKPTLQKETANGVTCTNNGDGTYTLNGTAIGYKAFVLTELHSNIGRFAGCKIVGLPSGTDTNNIDLSVSYRYENGDASHGNNFCDIVDDAQDTDKSVKVLLIVRHAQTISNVVVKPMLTTNLSATYDDFVPYTGDGETLASDVAEIKNDLGGLTFSASGTTLTITDGTNTWTLGANS